MADAWSRYPGYVIDLVPLRGIGRAIVGDMLVAESDRCLLVRESDHRDVLYFPRHSILVPVGDSERTTTCPFKGQARYGSLSIGDVDLDDVAWWYPEPRTEVAGLADHVSFYADRVAVTASIPFADGGESTSTFPIWGTADDLVALMDVAAEGDGRFTAPAYPNPPIGTFFDLEWHGQRRIVVEGGQLLGAAIVAAAKSRPDHRVTSAHIAFVKSASFDAPVELVVDARRLGRTVSAFDIRVEQGGALRASALVMTCAEADDLIQHHTAMPDVPPPEECPPLDFKVLGRQLRVVDGAYSLQHEPAGPPDLYVWTRFAQSPASPALQLALLAQATTHYSINAAMRPHEGVAEIDAHRTISTGPVSATIAFHDAFDVSEWLLTETRSIWAGRGMTQSQVRVFTADGRLVASKTVQAIVRTFDRTPEQLGQDYSTVM